MAYTPAGADSLPSNVQQSTIPVQEIAAGPVDNNGNPTALNAEQRFSADEVNRMLEIDNANALILHNHITDTDIHGDVAAVQAALDALETQVEEETVLEWKSGHTQTECWYPDQSGEPEFFFTVSDFAQYSTEQPGTGNVWIKAGLDGGTF